MYSWHPSSSLIALCGEQVVDSTTELLTFVHTASTALDIDVTEENKNDQPGTAQVHDHRLVVSFAIHVGAYAIHVGAYAMDWHMSEWEALGHL